MGSCSSLKQGMSVMSYIGSENFEFCLKQDREIRGLCLKQGQGLNARAVPPYPSIC